MRVFAVFPPKHKSLTCKSVCEVAKNGNQLNFSMKSFGKSSDLPGVYHILVHGLHMVDKVSIWSLINCHMRASNNLFIGFPRRGGDCVFQESAMGEGKDVVRVLMDLDGSRTSVSSKT